MKRDDVSSMHELIKGDQKASARPLGNLNPSEVKDVYWLYADNLTGNYPKSTLRSGKWLLFVPTAELDAVWERVKKATEAGKFGGDSKVSSAKPNPNAVDPTRAVIYVYTYDSEDKDDLMRVREELRKLGFVNKIPYKTDGATLSGKHSTRGGRNISRYCR